MEAPFRAWPGSRFSQGRGYLIRALERLSVTALIYELSGTPNNTPVLHSIVIRIPTNKTHL